MWKQQVLLVSTYMLTLIASTGDDDCSKCPKGSGVKIEGGVIVGYCNEEQDTQCEPCEDGSFSDQVNQYEICHECNTECSSSQYIVSPCNTTQNIICMEKTGTSPGTVAPTSDVPGLVSTDSSTTTDSTQKNPRLHTDYVVLVIVIAAVIVIAVVIAIFVIYVCRQRQRSSVHNPAMKSIAECSETTDNYPGLLNDINQQTPNLYNQMVTNDEHQIRSIPNSRSEKAIEDVTLQMSTIDDTPVSSPASIDDTPASNQTQDDTEDQRRIGQIFNISVGKLIIEKNRLAFRKIFDRLEEMQDNFVQNGLTFAKNCTPTKCLEELQERSWETFVSAMKSIAECSETTDNYPVLLNDIKKQTPHLYNKMVTNDEYKHQIGSIPNSRSEGSQYTITDAQWSKVQEHINGQFIYIS